MNTAKNHMEGPNKTVIGGTLLIEPGATYINTKIATDVPGLFVDRGHIAHLHWDAPLAADTDGIHAAVDGTNHTGVNAITTGITQPDYPRCVTATAGGTAGSIKAIAVTITGTDIMDNAIVETLSAFTTDTAETVESSSAFKTITKIEIPAHDAASGTTSIGFSTSLGINYKLSSDTSMFCTIKGVQFQNSRNATTNYLYCSYDSIDISKNYVGLRCENMSYDGEAPFDTYIAV